MSIDPPTPRATDARAWPDGMPQRAMSGSSTTRPYARGAMAAEGNLGAATFLDDASMRASRESVGRMVARLPDRELREQMTRDATEYVERMNANTVYPGAVSTETALTVLASVHALNGPSREVAATAVRLSHKFQRDQNYTAEAYTRFLGVPSDKLNKRERDVLQGLDFRLSADPGPTPRSNQAGFTR